MVAAFPAPTHIRGNAAAREELLGIYRRALARFDRSELEQGWQKAAAENEMWLWPRVSAIVSACESFQPRKKAEPTGAWVERAQAMVDGYWKKFSKSAAAGRAREQGYEPELKRYVLACAWVQSQYICGRQGVGYDHAVLFPGREREKQAEAEWFTAQREQAAKGTIQVRVPPDLVKLWRGRVEGQARGR